MEKGNLFIKINNKLITEKTNYHTTERELYLLSMLVREENREKKVLTTLSLLSGFLPIPFASREDNSVKYIKEALLSMKEKGIINIINPNGEVVNEMKAHDPILIILIEIEGKGHIQISYDKFESFTSITDYYIYVAVARWEKAGGFKCSFDRWAELLHCSERRVKTVIKKAVAQKIIYKNTGDYKEGEINVQKKQEQNVYKTVPFRIEEKTNMTKKNETIAASSKFKSEIETDDVIESGIYMFSTYKDDEGQDIYPELADYKLYIEVKRQKDRTEQELHFMKIAEKRMNQMKNNPKSIELYEQAEEEMDYEFEAKPNETVSVSTSKTKFNHETPKDAHLMF